MKEDKHRQPGKITLARKKIQWEKKKTRGGAPEIGEEFYRGTPLKSLPWGSVIRGEKQPKGGAGDTS